MEPVPGNPLGPVGPVAPGVPGGPGGPGGPAAKLYSLIAVFKLLTISFSSVTWFLSFIKAEHPMLHPSSNRKKFLIFMKYRASKQQLRCNQKGP